MTYTLGAGEWIVYFVCARFWGSLQGIPLKSQLGEEPLVLAGIVARLEGFAYQSPCLYSLSLFQGIGFGNLLEIKINPVPAKNKRMRRKHMVCTTTTITQSSPHETHIWKSTPQQQNPGSPHHHNKVVWQWPLKVPGGHQMIVIDVFDERLYSGSFGDLSLSHGFGHTTRVSIHTCHKRMAIWARFGAFIIILYNHGFPSCVSPRGDDNNFAWLQAGQIEKREKESLVCVPGGKLTIWAWWYSWTSKAGTSRLGGWAERKTEKTKRIGVDAFVAGFRSLGKVRCWVSKKGTPSNRAEGETQFAILTRALRKQSHAQSVR